MSIRSLLPFAATLALAAATEAQGCAHERARTVPAAVTFWGMQPCGGLRFQAGTIQFDTTAKGCPLVAIYTPEHEVAEPTANDTRVEESRKEPVQLIFFRCETDYFLFVPIGTSCVFQHMQAGGPVSRLQTVGCAPAQP